jgi:hypothetical protein
MSRFPSRNGGREDMAKQGERQPWRVKYKWSNGVGGSRTYTTLPRAELFRDEMLENEQNSSRGWLSVLRIEHRETGDVVYSKPGEK